MSDFLQSVIEERLTDVVAARQKVPFSELQRRVAGKLARRSLLTQLRLARGRTCIIAEIKRASPSAGLLRPECSAIDLAREYEQAGAVGISVVTEPRHFMGRDEDVSQVAAAVKAPVLRKDFICDPYQVYETAALGADVILLIAAALDFTMLRELYIISLAIRLDVIVEVHNREELEMILPLASAILGVNSRDLHTLKTDLSVARELAACIPADRVCIAESGIQTRRDVEELQALGYRGFLIGEVLMKSRHPGIYLHTLLGQTAQRGRPSEPGIQP